MAVTNVASEAVDRRADDQEADVLAVPQSSEPSLNQQHCASGSMRATAQKALDASITIGCGPDMYDDDGDQRDPSSQYQY